MRTLTALVLALLAPFASAQTPEPSPVPPGTPAPAAVPPGTPAPAAVPPPAPQRQVAFVLELGGDFGSEEVVSLDLSDGSTQTLDANDGFWMNVGLAFLRVELKPKVAIDTSATIGFKYRSVGADNGSIRYLAYPLEVSERLWVGPFRFGAGITMALSPSYKGDGDFTALFGEIPLKNSLGFMGTAAWVGERAGAPRSGWVLGVRYIWQKLETEATGATIDANAFGFILGLEL